jgi:hypothetical protein
MVIFIRMVARLRAAEQRGVSVEPAAGRISQSQTKDSVVYTTKTGEKYYRDGCRYLRQSKIKTTRKEAIKDGYGACKVCKP